MDRLNSLLNDLLNLQRTREAAPQLQAVLPVIQHCVRLLERQAEMHSIRVRIQAPEQEILACFDSGQLTQIIMNLLLNALEASKPGGAVVLSIAEESSGIKIEVQDDGPGLKPEDEEHLFEPFYTTKSSGTGLGLAVSRELN